MARKIRGRISERQDKEHGVVRKDWSGRVRVALAFPNRYAVAMSNLGFQTVYGALNEPDDLLCERVYYPDPNDLDELRRGSGTLLSAESRRPLREFDFLFFSLSFENDFPNVLEILRLAHIPPRQADRSAAFPMVAMGGVAAILNPEPLASYMDFVFAGESEAILPPFLDYVRTSSDRPMDRKEWLRGLGQEVPGVYVPSLYEPLYSREGFLEALNPLPGEEVPGRVRVERADLSSVPPSRTVVLTPNTEFSNVLLLEIGRGCGHGCRFCAAGYVYRPVRMHRADRLIDAVASDPSRTERIGLVSAAVSDHPEIDALCSALLERGGSLSFSSLRADTLSETVLAALDASAHQAVAIAPEAGSERLRRVINKHLSDQEIFHAVEVLTERKILHLKLYFMIGLPTETLEDLEAIVALTKRIKHHVLNRSRGLGRMGTITLSIHSFVPKPWTPFQWSAFAGVGTLKERARWIQTALRKVANVRVHFDLPKWAYIQALLARGDRRVGRLLEMVALEGVGWSSALKNLPYNPDYFAVRERGKEEYFPWEILDMGVRRAFLWDEYQRAMEGKESPGCPPDPSCRRCGVCGG